VLLDAVREKQDEVINFLNGFVDKENKNNSTVCI